MSTTTARRPRVPNFVALGCAALLCAALSCPAHAAPTVGFMETWPGTSTQGWGGSFSITYSNPGTGGVGGTGDGFLMLSQSIVANFGARSVGLEYTGNWRQAGITQVRFWLNDVGAGQAFEIHFSVGNFNNLWQYNQGFIPPLGQWAPFVVDLQDATKFTQIIEPLSHVGYAAALDTVAVVLVRHDLPPFTQFPEAIAGDLGIDNLLLTNGVLGWLGGDAEPTVTNRPVELGTPYPNPSRGPVTIGVRNPDGAPVRIEILDSQGRRVRGEALSASAAPRLWMWDGADDRGRPAPAGVYKVRAFGQGGGTSLSLVRVR